MNEQNCSNAELEKNILHKNIKDISDTLNFIHSKEKIKYFKKLENPSSLFSTFLILYLWSGIFIGWYLTAWIHFLFFPISIVIISINQRTLRNILHDASHNNLYSNQKLSSSNFNLYIIHNWKKNGIYNIKNYINEIELIIKMDFLNI